MVQRPASTRTARRPGAGSGGRAVARTGAAWTRVARVRPVGSALSANRSSAPTPSGLVRFA
jgi:hypothetical protein